MNDTTIVEIPLAQTDEKPVEVALEKAAPASSAAPIISADEGIESLKEQVERAKRESAQRLAEKDRQIAEAFRQSQEAQKELTTVKKDQVGTIIDSLNKDKAAARRDYAAAMAAQDYDKAAKAQDDISLYNAKIVAAERGKMDLEEAANAPLSGRNVAQPVALDEVETVARGMSSQRAADWVRRHPEHVVNGRISDAALGAHNSAMNSGHVADSDGYFEYINAALNGRQPRVEPKTQAERGREISRAPVAAPVGRDVAQSPGAQRPGSVRLEAHEVRAAIDTLTPLYPKATKDELLKIYAQNKQDLIAEGKITARAS